jgi:hypothetical protein
MRQTLKNLEKFGTQNILELFVTILPTSLKRIQPIKAATAAQ